MNEYINADSLELIANLDLSDYSDKEIAVELANAWLNGYQLPAYASVTDVPKPIVLAGAKIIQGYMAGEMFSGNDGLFVKRKKSKADVVETEVEYSENIAAKKESQYEVIAYALIKPFIVVNKGGYRRLTVVRGF